jgi:hypothetical protein
MWTDWTENRVGGKAPELLEKLRSALYSEIIEATD